MLFTSDAELAQAASEAGVDRIVIDLEQRGKAERQHGYHLECNKHAILDIARMKTATSCTVVCRVNSVEADSAMEIEAALEAGADVIMLPMFRSLDEVARFLAIVRGRARTSLLFETRESISLAPRLVGMPFDEVYVGLNDLAIAYGRLFCYQLIEDGIVNRVRDRFPNKPFGFGGITVLDGGSPLPTRDILKELARMKASHVIVRRAFKRDIRGRDLMKEVAGIKRYYAECRLRSAEEIERDRKAIARRIDEVTRESELAACHREAGAGVDRG